MYGCVFCAEKFKRLMELIGHLVEFHKETTIEIVEGQPCAAFRVYKAASVFSAYETDRKILCFCGERFTQNKLELRYPLFEVAILVDDRPGQNSFLAHLLRERGLESHLRHVRDHAVMERVAGTAKVRCHGDHERGG